MSEGTYSVGDPVWAKLKGFSPWPGKISDAPDGLKQPARKKTLCVYFFGTENYAFIEYQFIKPFSAHRDKLCKVNKSNQFKEALAVIDNYVLLRIGSQSSQHGDGGESPLTGHQASSQVKKSRDLSSKKQSARSGVDALKKRSSVHATKSSSNSGGAARALNGSPVKQSRAKHHSDTSDDERPVKKKKYSFSRASVDQSVSPELSVPRGSTAQEFCSELHRSSASNVEKTFSSLDSQSASTKRVASLLDRPTLVSRPESPQLNIGHASSTLKEKKISASELRFGMIGLGVMGSGIANNLLSSGHQLNVWNRSSDKCEQFAKVGAEQGLTPGDVVGAADITFCCVSDPHVAKDIIFGNCGVLQEVGTTKGYVEMTGIDSETSQDIADAIGAKGGRYLEAQLQGSKDEASEGTLVILCAGDRSLFDDCQSCFQAISKNSFYLGEVGNASRMNLVLQLMYGVQLSAMAEGLALADRAGLRLKDVLEVFSLTSQACPMLVDKALAIIDGSFSTQMALKYMQKDLRLCMLMSDRLEQPLSLAASANELFKHAKRVGYGDHDVAAVYIRARF